MRFSPLLGKPSGRSAAAFRNAIRARGWPRPYLEALEDRLAEPFGLGEAGRDRAVSGVGEGEAAVDFDENPLLVGNGWKWTSTIMFST